MALILSSLSFLLLAYWNSKSGFGVIHVRLSFQWLASVIATGRSVSANLHCRYLCNTLIALFFFLSPYFSTPTDRSIVYLNLCRFGECCNLKNHEQLVHQCSKLWQKNIHGTYSYIIFMIHIHASYS